MTNPTSMVTKVARAIEAAGIEWCENSDLSDPGFSDMPEEVFACAAILALRWVPYDAWWGCDVVLGIDSAGQGISGTDADSIWQYRIDAILAEDAGK